MINHDRARDSILFHLRRANPDTSIHVVKFWRHGEAMLLASAPEEIIVPPKFQGYPVEFRLVKLGPVAPGTPEANEQAKRFLRNGAFMRQRDAAIKPEDGADFVYEEE
jgi:hypothetical protein